MTLYYLGNRSKLMDSTLSDTSKTDFYSAEPTTRSSSVCSDLQPVMKKGYVLCSDIIEEQNSELEESPGKMPTKINLRLSSLLHPLPDLDNFVPSFVESPNKSHDEILYNTKDDFAEVEYAMPTFETMMINIPDKTRKSSKRRRSIRKDSFLDD